MLLQFSSFLLISITLDMEAVRFLALKNFSWVTDDMDTMICVDMLGRMYIYIILNLPEERPESFYMRNYVSNSHWLKVMQLWTKLIWLET